MQHQEKDKLAGAGRMQVKIPVVFALPMLPAPVADI